MTNLKVLLFLSAVSLVSHAQASQGKLIATAGLLQVEGAGGGGLVPWATLSGYDTQDEISVSAGMTQVSLRDYRLQTVSVNASFYDQVELSLSKQTFDLSTLGGDIKQNIVGIKYRLLGDAVYSKWPQISVGIMHKSLEDKSIANALGASSTSGTDIYLAATKVHLGAVFGYNAVWGLTARATKANEIGLLGFGSENNDSYKVMAEATLGLLFSRNLAIGVEYRQKPDNLGLKEDDWADIFITYIPTKSVNFTLAWTDLGTIAGAPKQQGLYVSISGQLF